MCGHLTRLLLFCHARLSYLRLFGCDRPMRACTAWRRPSDPHPRCFVKVFADNMLRFAKGVEIPVCLPSHGCRTVGVLPSRPTVPIARNLSRQQPLTHLRGCLTVWPASVAWLLLPGCGAAAITEQHHPGAPGVRNSGFGCWCLVSGGMPTGGRRLPRGCGEPPGRRIVRVYRGVNGADCLRRGSRTCRGTLMARPATARGGFPDDISKEARLCTSP